MTLRAKFKLLIKRVLPFKLHLSSTNTKTVAEECIINTFSYSVDIPLSGSPLSGYFKLNFGCNGVNYQSDTLNSLDDLQNFVDSVLGSYGDWDIDGLTLTLSGTLCESASLTVTEIAAPISPLPTPENPEGGNHLLLDSSSPQAITDVWGIAAVDVSVKGRKALDTDWINKVDALEGKFVEPVTGSTSQWALFKASGDGYNIVIGEVISRAKNINTLLGGVGSKTYGYGFFEDALAYIVQMSPEPSVTVSFDLIRPELTSTYVTTKAEIDYVVSACATAGVTIRCFQLCYEMGLSENNDVFSNATEIGVVTQTVTDYITANYPTIKISVDANNADDVTLNFPTLNSVMNNLDDVDYVRQYFQFRALTYEENLIRLAEFPSFLDKYQAQFSNGQKMRLAQTEIKNTTNILHKVGEGLINAQMFIQVVNENISRSNLIVDHVQFNISHLVQGNGALNPAYYFALLIRNASRNNGKIDYQITGDVDTSQLVILATLNGAVGEVYIVNNSSEFIMFDDIKLNGVAKSVSTQSRYGDTISDTALLYTDSGTEILLYPHSLTKLTTL